MGIGKGKVPTILPPTTRRDLWMLDGRMGILSETEGQTTVNNSSGWERAQKDWIGWLTACLPGTADTTAQPTPKVYATRPSQLDGLTTNDNDRPQRKSLDDAQLYAVLTLLTTSGTHQ
ncbi:unnamed protein product [Toxocara canis]|uniref:Transposase n=1 Tax=Toxocara canis TaxID=6265 RepID=A0A183V6J7_TOXCA|nr:unnamed protein product [Toxocara canis]